MVFETTPCECELVGAIIGDGNIYCNGRKRLIGFTGNQITDKEYYGKLKQLIKFAWGREVRVFFRENAIRIQFHSKTVVERLVSVFDLPCNKGKHLIVKIPDFVEADWQLAKHVIRGIADTDGSVFVSDKKGAPNYPSIEITTTSLVLAKQLKRILELNGFRVANIWSYKSKKSVHFAYKVALNGKVNLAHWLSEIGFSNECKLNKAFSALQHY